MPNQIKLLLFNIFFFGIDRNQIWKWVPTCFFQRCSYFVCLTLKIYLPPWPILFIHRLKLWNLHLLFSGLKQTIYLPGDKVSINCTSSFSFPAAKLSWHLNNKMVDRWMVTSYLPTSDDTGLESSSLALSFLVLPEHFRGPEQVWK